MQPIKWARRAWHLAGVPIALIYWFGFGSEGRVTAAWICGAFSVPFLLLDIAKWSSASIRDWLLLRFSPIISSRDLHDLNSSSWYMIGCTLTIALFETPAAATGILVMAVADNAASIIGRLWGRHRVGDKSLEGTAAFVVVGTLVGLPFGPIWVALSAAVLGAVGELFIPWLDDNFTVPLLAATGFWMASHF